MPASAAGASERDSDPSRSTTSATVSGAPSLGGGLRIRPQQRDRLGGVADIVAAHPEQHRIDPFLDQRADDGRLHRRQIEIAGQRRHRPAAIGIGRGAR